MIVALVHYREWVPSPHAMLDGRYVDRSKVVEFESPLELNEMFKNITKIQILKITNTDAA